MKRYEKKQLTEGTKFIKKIDSIQTGGDVYNDVILLKNNNAVVITLDAIYFYKNYRGYEDGELWDDNISRV